MLLLVSFQILQCQIYLMLWVTVAQMLVVSLLCPEAALEEGARRIARHVEAHA